ncbi:hypothetical protein ACIQU6_06035 [Streptomyces sp. NPDC090442]|uniref:hypothetical protein n=1 Tax=Streptomyces sp. NPDC090442 TaxID=3365962 RepID=UPI0037FA32F9
MSAAGPNSGNGGRDWGNETGRGAGGTAYDGGRGADGGSGVSDRGDAGDHGGADECGGAGEREANGRSAGDRDASGDAGFGGEDELRRLLRSSVADLEPTPDALEQLRRAVPARRQRRRHVMVGAAAALLLGGTAVPAMVHVANFSDDPGDRPANAASSRDVTHDTGGARGEGPTRTSTRPIGGNDATPGPERPSGKADKGAEQTGTGLGVGDDTPSPDATMDVTSPVCGREQLGKGTGTVGAADSTGRVYGAFRLVNTSNTACTVQGGGTVDLTPQGSTKADKVHVVDHTSGDEATGLPDPATTPDQLVLKPGQAYEVKFAWIPAAGGGKTGCTSPGPSPTPDPSKAPGASPAAVATTGDGGGTAGQAGGGEGTPNGGAAAGGVLLTHTPEAGEPVAADAKIPDACAGTVYRTAPVAAP